MSSPERGRHPGSQINTMQGPLLSSSGFSANLREIGNLPHAAYAWRTWSDKEGGEANAGKHANTAFASPIGRNRTIRTGPAARCVTYAPYDPRPEWLILHSPPPATLRDRCAGSERRHTAIRQSPVSGRVICIDAEGAEAWLPASRSAQASRLSALRGEVSRLTLSRPRLSLAIVASLSASARQSRNCCKLLKKIGHSPHAQPNRIAGSRPWVTDGANLPKTRVSRHPVGS